MNFAPIYLAIMQVSGKRSGEALRLLSNAYGEMFPNDPPLKLSAADATRIKQGRIPRKLLSDRVTAAAMIACGVEASAEPEKYFELQAKQPRIHAILSGYRTKMSRAASFDRETQTVLCGVWQQMNLSSVNIEEGEVVELQIRFSLRMIYEQQGMLKSHSIGISTEWTGSVTKSGNYIHISEGIRDNAYAEKAFFIFRYPFFVNRTTTPVTTGGLLIVARSTDNMANSHIFGGKTVMRKLNRLSVQYMNDINAFVSDRKELRNDYCFRGNSDELSKSQFSNESKKYIDMLRNDDLSGIDDMAYFVV